MAGRHPAGYVRRLTLGAQTSAALTWPLPRCSASGEEQTHRWSAMGGLRNFAWRARPERTAPFAPGRLSSLLAHLRRRVGHDRRALVVLGFHLGGRERLRLRDAWRAL